MQKQETNWRFFSHYLPKYVKLRKVRMVLNVQIKCRNSTNKT